MERQLHEHCLREKEIDDLKDEFSYFRKNTVSFAMFWSVVTVALAIVGGILNNAYSQIDELEKTEDQFHKDIESQVNSDRLVQTRIEAQLSQIQKDLLEIKKELVKIQ